MEAHGVVRGTQSFVGVMAAVARRPSLMSLEILWRWVTGIPTLLVAAWEATRIAGQVTIDFAALKAMTVFKPVAAVDTMAGVWRGLAPHVMPVLVWLVPAALVWRMVGAGVGRALVQWRLDKRLRPSPVALFLLSALRAVAVLLVLAAFIVGVRCANYVAILGPAARGAEPNLVLFCAMVVFGVLALFVTWAAVIWVIDVAFVIAGERRLGAGTSLREALRIGPLRSKLVEINLVMGIVKVALIVLGMVFSACPLPFETVESQTFLAWWWFGVAVLYLIASDYFHVVRTAAYAALFRAHEER